MAIKKLFVWAMLTIMPYLLCAQETPKGSLNITTGGAELRSDGKGNMIVEFNINPNGIRLTPDEQLVMVPLVKDNAGHSLMLPQVVVNGRRRSKVEKRMERISHRGDGKEAIYKVIGTGRNGEVDVIRYRTSIAHKPWMDKAGLYLQSEFCGCGGNGQEFAERLVAAEMKAGPRQAAAAEGTGGLRGESAGMKGDNAYATGGYGMSPDGFSAGESPAICTASGTPAEAVQIAGRYVMPYVTFLEPVREVVKRRSERGSAYITYLPGSAEIRPTLAENYEELEKIAKSLHLAGRDAHGDLAITGIAITSYSSPEGPWKNNLELSRKRAGALRDYIVGHFNLPGDCRVTAEGKGEDWDGLLKLVQDDPHVEARTEAVRIICETDVFKGREKQLMDLAGGRTYKYLMQRYFPQLRRSDYRIEYTVPEFDLDYGREMLEHQPGMLSHYELYTIAFSGYPLGSPMFNKVFYTARTLFPTDRVSQFNLGAVHLLEGKVKEAAGLLERFKDDPLAWNNLGVLYMMQGRNEESHAYLNRAIGSGNREAVENLKALQTIWKKARK